MFPFFVGNLRTLSSGKFCTTDHYALIPIIAILKNYYKSPFTKNNFHFCVESVADDNIYLDTLFIDDGSIYDPLFVRTESLVSYIHGIITDK